MRYATKNIDIAYLALLRNMRAMPLIVDLYHQSSQSGDARRAGDGDTASALPMPPKNFTAGNRGRRWWDFPPRGRSAVFGVWPGGGAPLSTPLPRYYLLPAEKERRRSAMDAKTIIGVAMVLFIIGALVFLKIRSKK